MLRSILLKNLTALIFLFVACAFLTLPAAMAFATFSNVVSAQIGITGATTQESLTQSGAAEPSGITTEDLGSEPTPNFVPGDPSSPNSNASSDTSSNTGTNDSNEQALSPSGAPPGAETQSVTPNPTSGRVTGEDTSLTEESSFFEMSRNYVGDPFSVTGILKVCGAFILVIILLLFFLKLVGKLSRSKAYKGGKEFTLKATMAMDSRRYLAAVEIDDRLLLGVTNDRITPLAHWSIGNTREMGDDIHVGNLDLENTNGKDFESKLNLNKEGLRSRDKLQEPSFYRGNTEEEEFDFKDKDFNFGIDEKDFSDPMTNDEFMDLDPQKDKDK